VIPKHLVSAMFLSLLAANCGAAETVTHITVTGPTIVAFLPLGTDKNDDHGSQEAIAHVQFALEDTRKCLGKYRASFKLVFADVVTLKTGSSTSTIRLTDKSQGVGAILLSLDKPPRYVAAHGPSVLMHLLPPATGEYFGVKGCKRDA
jgi:hypothetical protein